MTQRGVYIAIALIALVFLGWIAFKPTEIEPNGDLNTEIVNLKSDCDNPDLNIDNPNKVYSGKILGGDCVIVREFNRADYDKAVASGSYVLLYFYANWCPICRAEFPELVSAFSEVDVLPNSVVGFRVNYKDSETDEDEISLARDFGIAYQHTKVVLRGGERILKASDSWDKARYIKEINNLTNAK